MIASRVLAAAALAIVAGCGGSSASTGTTGRAVTAPADAGPTADTPADAGTGTGDPVAERTRRYQLLRDSLDGVDCPTYASRLRDWLARHTPHIRDLEQRIDDPANVSPELVEVFEIVLDLASDCVDDDDAQMAFDAFDELFIGG